MVTPGFYENTIHLALSAMMNANLVNEVNKANEAAEAEAEARSRARPPTGSLKRAAAAEEAAEREVAFADEQEEARAAAAWAAEREAWAEEQEEARAAAAEAEEEAKKAKKQRVDERWRYFTQRGTGESVMAEGLEQALSLIEELQSQLAEMEKWKKKYQALAAMLNDLGVDDNKIAEHLSNWKA